MRAVDGALGGVLAVGGGGGVESDDLRLCAFAAA